MYYTPWRFIVISNVLKMKYLFLVEVLFLFLWWSSLCSKVENHWIISQNIYCICCSRMCMIYTNPHILRMPLVIYDFATAPFWISLYMRKFFIFCFISAVKFSDQSQILRITNSWLCLVKVKYLNILLTELWGGSALCDWSIKVWKGKDCLAEWSLSLPLLRTGISRGSPSTHPPHPSPATDRGEGANNSSSV
jgi:hypothetical protein